MYITIENQNCFDIALMTGDINNFFSIFLTSGNKFLTDPLKENLTLNITNILDFQINTQPIKLVDGSVSTAFNLIEFK